MNCWYEIDGVLNPTDNHWFECWNEGDPFPTSCVPSSTVTAPRSADR